MPNFSRQDQILLSRLACQWISFMHSGCHREAERMLAPDCGLFGLQTAKHSHVFLPMLSLKWLPRLRVRRIYAMDNWVSLHVTLADCGPTTQLYRICFRFRFAKITKVDLSALLYDCTLLHEQAQFELPLGEVTLFRL